MKKSLMVIIFSAFIALMLLPGGYGAWTDVLTIKGRIKVVEPPPPPPAIAVPTPTPTATPTPEDGAVIIAPPDNIAGEPELTDNTGDQVEQPPERVQPMEDPEVITGTGDSSEKDEPADGATELETGDVEEKQKEEHPKEEQPDSSVSEDDAQESTTDNAEDISGSDEEKGSESEGNENADDKDQPRSDGSGPDNPSSGRE